MYFGKGCSYFVGQWEMHDEDEIEEPELVYCNHKNNQNESEGNCSENQCPLYYKENDFLNLDNSDRISIVAINKIDITSAKEARGIIDGGKYKKAITQLELIKREINVALADGRSSITGDWYLEKAVKDKLEALGYKYDSGSQYNESYYSISW